MDAYGTDDSYGVDDYGPGEVTIPAGTPITPEVIPITELPVMPIRTQAIKGLGALGDFSVSGACSIRALSRVAYRFFTQLQNGDTSAALATLGVWRSLYNARRSGFASGFSAQAQALLPASLPQVEWSDALRQAMAVVIAGGLGNGHPALATLESLPVSMGSVGAWFLRFQGALDPGNITFLREYVDLPMQTGANPAQVLVAAVNDDLASCVPPPAPTPPPPSSPPVVPRNPTTSTTAGGGGASAGGGAPTADGSIMPRGAPVSSATASLMTVGLAVVVGYGIYLASKDKPGAPKSGRLSELAHPDLAEKARKAAAFDAKKMGCVTPKDYRDTVSMDESAGPKGVKLAAELAKVEPTTANAIEVLYFEELGKLLPKTCPAE